MGSSGTEASVTCKEVLAPLNCSETGDTSYIYAPPALIPLFDPEVNIYLTSYHLEGCSGEKYLRERSDYDNNPYKSCNSYYYNFSLKKVRAATQSASIPVRIVGCISGANLAV